MSDPRTIETELLDVMLTLLARARKVSVDKVRSAQDAMLNMRIDWEELQSRLRSRKIDGFEPAVDAMIQLAATTLAMASTLQARIINQRIKQLQGDTTPIVEHNQLPIAKTGKQKKRKALKSVLIS